MRQESMTAGGVDKQYVWHPAADDRELARACMDVRAGRYRGSLQALQACRQDFGLRAHRSLVLASESADSDLVERWLAEEPSPESTLMWARVAVLRAVRSADARNSFAADLERIALAACRRAAEAAPADPTPSVAQLALTRLRMPQDPPPRGLLTAPPGPWRLFAHILRLDPWNREAHHRFLTCFFTRHGGSANQAWDVAAFLGQRAPITSPLRLLPLVALVEEHDRGSPLAHRVWEQPQWKATALSAFEHWFPQVAGYRYTPVLDLAYLAHALVMGKCTLEARPVLLTMGRYASRMPWSVWGHPAERLDEARRVCGLPVPGTD